MLDLSKFQETGTMRTVRMMEISEAWWIPPDNPDDDIVPWPLMLEYDPDEDDGGSVYMRVWGDQNGPELLLTGHEFLAILAFLLEEGLAEACGLAGMDVHTGAEEPAPGKDGDGEEVTGEPEPPFPLPELAPGSCDRSLLRDADWLRAMHCDHQLSAADIGRLCGVSGNTVINWLNKNGIPFRSVRGRSNTQRVPAP